jgi:hypothetical protein
VKSKITAALLGTALALTGIGLSSTSANALTYLYDNLYSSKLRSVGAGWVVHAGKVGSTYYLAPVKARKGGWSNNTACYAKTTGLAVI